MHNPPMLSRRGAALVVAMAAALVGCGNVNDDRPARWSFISATITEPSCATVGCHSAVAQRAGVDLHDRATGFASLKNHGWVLPVDSTMPITAPIVHLLHAEGSLRMPPDQPLPEDDVALIVKWIGAGANND
jgi:hypothetical protein